MPARSGRSTETRDGIMIAALGIIAALCAGLGAMSAAQAQTSSSSRSISAIRAELPGNGGRTTLSNEVIGWRAALLRKGILSDTGPYRVALPLATYGDDGPRLLFTYIPRMKDGVGNRVLMFMIKADLD